LVGNDSSKIDVLQPCLQGAVVIVAIAVSGPPIAPGRSLIGAR
jgi:hypothetical protein